LHVADASPLGAVDQIEHVFLLLLRNLQPGRRIDAWIARSDADHDQQQCRSNEGPTNTRLIFLLAAVCRNSAIFQGL
jgi:hypothetical protein